MTGPARSRPGGRSARVRCEVMGAVVELLGEGGVEAVSVAEVARRAGVNPTSIYRRWRTVDVLILEAAHDLSLAAVHRERHRKPGERPRCRGAIGRRLPAQ